MVDHTRRTVLAAVGTGLALSTTATVGGATDDHEPADGARVVHLSPDAPPVDVYVDGEVAFEGVDPFATQSEYLGYTPGSYPAAFVPAGEDPDEAVLETEIALDSGEYTIAAVGEVCAVSGNELQFAQFEDDNSPTEPGSARLRVVHASPDAPAIDVSVDDERLVENLGFGDGEYATVPAGEAILAINETGADDPLARFRIESEAGSVYTGFGVGYLDPENAPESAHEIPFSLALVEDAAPGEQ
ncbi:MAG: DUF4397 domain-containing protein [Halalkalicoccus sp.]